MTDKQTPYYIPIAGRPRSYYALLAEMRGALDGLTDEIDALVVQNQQLRATLRGIREQLEERAQLSPDLDVLIRRALGQEE